MRPARPGSCRDEPVELVRSGLAICRRLERAKVGGPAG